MFEDPDAWQDMADVVADRLYARGYDDECTDDPNMWDTYAEVYYNMDLGYGTRAMCVDMLEKARRYDRLAPVIIDLYIHETDRDMTADPETARRACWWS